MKLKLKNEEINILLKLLRTALSHRRFDSGVSYTEYADDSEFVAKLIEQIDKKDVDKKNKV